MSLSEDERKVFEKELKQVESEGNQAIARSLRRDDSGDGACRRPCADGRGWHAAGA